MNSAVAGPPESQDAVAFSPDTCQRSCSGLRNELVESVFIEPVFTPVFPEAQRRWAAKPVAARLQVLRAARHWMAANAESFGEAISPALQRSSADTLITELLPLLEAIKFLERGAPKLLAPRRLGRRNRPLWLTGVQAEIHREPLGHILVIGPANFPLFLPGVQTVQALAAGNAVTWKPGAGGRRIALLVAQSLRESGLPRGVLCVTDESVQAAQNALQQQPDKVVFTGSSESGQKVLCSLAETSTPAVMELSGADAVVVLPSADLSLAAKAIAFGLRLNGAEVCMSPRRLIATLETMQVLRPLLQAELETMAPVRLTPQTADKLQHLMTEAASRGAQLVGTLDATAQFPVLVDRATPEMRITRSDLFAPVLSLIEAPSVLHMPELVNDCPYALTAAIFGDTREAYALGEQLRVGAVLINDLIAPTADPRVPFGGLRRSGFGMTRGGEGLLEMTAVKTVSVRRKGSARHYDPAGAKELPLFTGLIGALHGGSLRERLAGLRAMTAAARKH